MLFSHITYAYVYIKIVKYLLPCSTLFDIDAFLIHHFNTLFVITEWITKCLFVLQAFMKQRITKLHFTVKALNLKSILIKYFLFLLTPYFFKHKIQLKFIVFEKYYKVKYIKYYRSEQYTHSFLRFYLHWITLMIIFT